jgi:hypothetical protein
MKLHPRTTILVLLALTPMMAFAGKRPAPTPPKVDEAAVALLKPYDKDSNYEISREEFAAIVTDFTANPTGPLKLFDRTGKGKLDDTVDRAYMNMKLGELKMNEQPQKPKKKKKEAK